MLVKQKGAVDDGMITKTVVSTFCGCCFQAPRVEAQTILGSLVCFPNVYHQIPLLQHMPSSDDVVVCSEDIKVGNSLLSSLQV